MIFSEEEKKDILSPDLLSSIGDYTPFETFHKYFYRAKEMPFLNRTQYVDMKTWLCDCMLVKVDRASMACGLEVRVPLLSPDLVNFALNLPPSYKLRGIKTKFIFREAVKKNIPPQIVKRRKRGFNSPVANWVINIKNPPLDLSLIHI